jgi:hypothetical protein
VIGTAGFDERQGDQAPAAETFVGVLLQIFESGSDELLDFRALRRDGGMGGAACDHDEDQRGDAPTESPGWVEGVNHRKGGHRQLVNIIGEPCSPVGSLAAVDKPRRSGNLALFDN